MPLTASCGKPIEACTNCSHSATDWDKRGRMIKNFYEPESDPGFDEDDVLSLPPDNPFMENPERDLSPNATLPLPSMEDFITKNVDTGIPPRTTAKTTPCSNCNGSGKVNTEGDYGISKLLDCEVCHGHGVILLEGERVEDKLTDRDTLPLPSMNFLTECSEGCDCSKCSKRNACDRASTENDADDILPLPM